MITDTHLLQNAQTIVLIDYMQFPVQVQGAINCNNAKAQSTLQLFEIFQKMALIF
jgi:hypothetical protein